MKREVKIYQMVQVQLNMKMEIFMKEVGNTSEDMAMELLHGKKMDKFFMELLVLTANLKKEMELGFIDSMVKKKTFTKDNGLKAKEKDMVLCIGEMVRLLKAF